MLDQKGFGLLFWVIIGFVFAVVLVGGFIVVGPPTQRCGFKITVARNIKTRECKEFSSTCLPERWLADSNCMP